MTPAQNSSNCTTAVLEDSITRNVEFVLLLILTPALGISGQIGNIIAAYIFSCRLQRCTNNVFLAGLAFFDAGVLCTAIVIYSVEFYVKWAQSYAAHLVWISYLKGVYFMSHYFQSGTVYMTTAATIERFVERYNRTHIRKIPLNLCGGSNIWKNLVFAIVVLTAFNITKLFEFDVVVNPNCTSIARFELQPSPLAKTWQYRFVFQAWICPLITLILPFILLLNINVWTITSMRQISLLRKHSSCLEQLARQRRHKAFLKKQREATVLMLIVVFLFLLCNTPGFVLTLIECIDKMFLIDRRMFYTLARDIVNFLTVFNSFMNFCLYVKYSRTFRENLRNLIFKADSKIPISRRRSSIFTQQISRIRESLEKRKISNCNGRPNYRPAHVTIEVTAPDGHVTCPADNGICVPNRVNKDRRGSFSVVTLMDSSIDSYRVRTYLHESQRESLI